MKVGKKRGRPPKAKPAEGAGDETGDTPAPKRKRGERPWKRNHSPGRETQFRRFSFSPWDAAAGRPRKVRPEEEGAKQDGDGGGEKRAQLPACRLAKNTRAPPRRGCTQPLADPR